MHSPPRLTSTSSDLNCPAAGCHSEVCTEAMKLGMQASSLPLLRSAPAAAVWFRAMRAAAPCTQQLLSAFRKEWTVQLANDPCCAALQPSVSGPCTCSWDDPGKELARQGTQHIAWLMLLVSLFTAGPMCNSECYSSLQMVGISHKRHVLERARQGSESQQASGGM